MNQEREDNNQKIFNGSRSDKEKMSDLNCLKSHDLIGVKAKALRQLLRGDDPEIVSRLLGIPETLLCHWNYKLKSSI